MERSLHNRSGLAPQCGPGFLVQNAFSPLRRPAYNSTFGLIAGDGRYRMHRKRQPISEGATIEEVQPLSLKVTWLLRTIAPVPDELAFIEFAVYSAVQLA
jgi:hypothetical protein